MATITVTIPNAILPRVIDGMAYHHGYAPTLENGDPNPETKAQFAQRKVREFIKQSVRDAEIEQARNTAAGAAGASADNDILLT